MKNPFILYVLMCLLIPCAIVGETIVDSVALPLAVPEDVFFDRAVFVGDSITVSLKYYVGEMRTMQPVYLGNAQFLAVEGMSARGAIASVSQHSLHPVLDGEKLPVEDAIEKLDVDTVYMMLGMNDILLSTIEIANVGYFLENYQMLIARILEKSPQVNVVIQSITPVIGSKDMLPANSHIEAYNAALIDFCLQHGYTYLDVNQALCNEQGELPRELCSDPDTMGIHLNDEACSLWVKCLRAYAQTHIHTEN